MRLRGLAEYPAASWDRQAVVASRDVGSPLARSVAHTQASASPVMVSTTGRFGGRGATPGFGRSRPVKGADELTLAAGSDLGYDIVNFPKFDA